LTSALVGGEWSASRPGRFTPSTHWIGGWAPEPVLDDVENIKFFTLPGLELRPLGLPARGQSLSRLLDIRMRIMLKGISPCDGCIYQQQRSQFASGKEE
jgi:hypothetical protein